MVISSSTITMPISSLCSSFNFFAFDFAAFAFGVVTFAFDFAVLTFGVVTFAFDFAVFTFGVVTFVFDAIFFVAFFSVINVEKQEVTLFLNIMQNNSFKKVESKTHVLIIHTY